MSANFIPGLNNNLAGLRFIVEGQPVDFFLQDVRVPNRVERDADGTLIEFFSGFHFTQKRQRGRRDGDSIVKIGNDFYLLSVVP